MHKYNNSLLDAPVLQEVLDPAERTASRYEVVKKIVDFVRASDGYFFRVQWEV